MCGISGIFNFSGEPVQASRIESMNKLIHHRGPDGSGVYTEANLGIGSTRLAIIDLRKIADQPMFDSDGRYVIVYNGEIFNYIELRNELLKKGYNFNNNSDTEVILNAYKEYGENCLHRLNGMWSMAIWDKKEKSLFCSRDRYGIKPFYYFNDGKRFIFGSEIRQILDNGVERIVNDNMVYDYLIFHFIDHTEETFFKNIFKLPAGWKIKASANEFKVSKWYELPQNKMESGNIKTLYQDFYNLLYDSVRIRLRSDVEVGSCLSGGLDSSSIVCLMHDILHNEGKAEIQKTYTACYEEPEIDERKYVEEVIRQTNSTKYYLFPDGKGLAEDFDNMVWHQEEPFTGTTVFAQWSVFKKIHETGIKVVLDGQGSDEILIGYFSFFPFHLKRILWNPFKLFPEFFGGIATSNLGFVKFSENLVYFNTPSVRYRHVMSNSKAIAEGDFTSSKNRRDIFETMVASKNLSGNRLSNLWNISLPSLLRYEDKNSMAFSVEARLPFLDHRLVEFVFSIPLNLLIKKGWTKHVLRESMKNKIPEYIRMRKGKLAFSVPQKKWIVKSKKFFSESLQNDFRSGRFLDKSKILNILRSDNFNDKLFIRAFNLEKWMKVFNLNS
jgi:asparagine synthase (glutamine-hydrolysing)